MVLDCIAEFLYPIRFLSNPLVSTTGRRVTIVWLLLGWVSVCGQVSCLIPRLHDQAGLTSCYMLAGRASSMFARRLLDDCFV